MTFAWPWMLVTLAVLPLLGLGYRRLLRRREARRTELASLGLVVSGSVGGRRRHVAPALLLAALALLLVGVARPEAIIAEPRREGTVVLAFDASTSMAATDLAPTRLEAAKVAARAFVERQPSTIKVGVVAFSDSGVITQRPTTNQREVLAAIDRLTPGGGTALGRGIQTSLSAIAGKTVVLDEPSESGESGESGAGEGSDIGYYGAAAVILLSDGENTAQPDPLDVARLASVAGVQIYPIGIGSAKGAVLQVDGFQIATALDEKLLQDIASTTDGRYFAAADERSLAQVYGSVDLQWTTAAKHTEVTALFAAAAALLLLAGVGLSFLWFGRVI